MTGILPQNPYITAVSDALTAAGFPVADDWTSEAETFGVYCHLNAVITLDPDITGLDEDEWPHGLILLWEWHTGREEQYERGPSWQWAELLDHGRNADLDPLPVHGYAAPSAIVTAVRAVIESGKAGPPVLGEWDQAAELTAAVERWDATDHEGRPGIDTEGGAR
ncbi:hypothetical protein HUT19_20735 [Streptomyces sp. NA02950]|uniref:hypothetical protein n=1 Tax=Streptomyces sp. NA02950 TaxID=2742137 RepID=UPI00158FA5A9|nr:hypothetical protein [Streptomyces sp. NA02950]QKV93887.1 hypothetical protein HUT19_20735 [Streptomyces sp. NA02950]